jgi:arginine exporter protein ArgO
LKDSIKEEIGMIKTYIGVVTATIIAVTTGIIRLFLSEQHSIYDIILLWIGIIFLTFFGFLFANLVVKSKEKIKEMKELE